MSGRLSPWAERFRLIGNDRPSILNEDGLTHSGLAIEYPKRHPKFYHDPISEDDMRARPRNGVEVDRLFVSEDMQRAEFGGATTREVAALNRFLFISNQFGIESGGHLSQDDQYLFAEAFSRRSIQVNESGWLPFLQKHHWLDLDIENGSVPEGGPWSVDNPEIWDNLKASIELANRIFVALAVDRDNRFEALIFGRLVYWRDFALFSDVRAPSDDASVLLTPEMELRMAAALNTSPWQSELAGLPEEARLHAMYIDFDAIAEAGHAIEKGLLGGQFNCRPFNSKPLSFILVEWPLFNSAGDKNLNHPIFQAKSPGFGNPLPVLYMSKIFSSEFWDNEFGPRKTSPMYWQTDMFRNWTLNDGNEKDWDRFDRAIASTWRERKREEYFARRSWFKTYYMNWCKTPWQNLRFRIDLEAYAEGFRKHDEFRCDTMTLYLLESLDWTDKTAFFSSLPSESFSSNLWVFFTIGLLMSAAMPIRHSRYEGLGHDAHYDMFTFRPSREALIAKQNDENYQVPMVRIAEDSDERARVSRILHRETNKVYDPFKLINTDSRKVEPEILATQMKYLELVGNILIHIRDAEAHISGSWYQEIERCWKHILVQRTDIMDQFPEDHTMRWAVVWPLSVPEFDPEDLNWMRWNQRDQIWDYTAQLSTDDIVMESPTRGSSLSSS
ncbi:hypothetical protein F4678DRAFT_481749 [Xylaria arbuscula]|nr:hypothetical protein F4678DRAFT_481749 [Xylaria arbuscula]